jgi:hypothetical protein
MLFLISIVRSSSISILKKRKSWIGLLLLKMSNTVSFLLTLDPTIYRPFITTEFNISTKTIAEIILSSNQSIFLKGPKSSGKQGLSRHLRRFTQRKGVLTVMGPNPCKGISDVIFSCLINLNRKKNILHSKNNQGILIMIEDLCLSSSDSQNQKLLEFIRQIEVSGQFYDPSTREILRIRDTKHIITSHDVDYQLEKLSPHLTVFSVEPKSNKHLELIFEISFRNFLNSLPNAETLSDIKFIPNFSKVVRFFLSFLESRIYSHKKHYPGNLLAKLFELENSFWQVDQKHFITRTGVIGVFHCEFQRLLALSIPLKEKQEEFKRELPKKLRLNLSSSLHLTELNLGVVSRLHIPGTTCFVSSRKEHINKLIEYLEDSPKFMKLTLNDSIMSYVLELNRFLDSQRPIWLTGNSFIGKKTALRLASHLSSMDLIDFGVRYVNQDNISLNLQDLITQKSLDKISKSEIKEKQKKGAKKWMGLSQDPGIIFSSFDNTLASVSRAENNFRKISKGIKINPLLEMLKEILMKCFSQILFQKKYFVLMIGEDLFNFCDQNMVNEVLSILECLITPYEVVSCFQKKEMIKIFVEGTKREKKTHNDLNFRDWFK